MRSVFHNGSERSFNLNHSPALPAMPLANRAYGFNNRQFCSWHSRIAAKPNRRRAIRRARLPSPLSARNSTPGLACASPDAPWSWLPIACARRPPAGFCVVQPRLRAAAAVASAAVSRMAASRAAFEPLRAASAAAVAASIRSCSRCRRRSSAAAASASFAFTSACSTIESTCSAVNPPISISASGSMTDRSSYDKKPSPTSFSANASSTPFERREAANRPARSARRVPRGS